MATHFLWDPIEDNIIEEYDDDGNTIVEYNTEPTLYGKISSQHRGDQTSYFHHDGIGNTITVTNENGDVTDTRAYNAFGEITESTGTTEFPFQFVGQKGYYRDKETGDYSVRRRPYEPVVARWLPLDPFGLADGTNLYQYAGNSPPNAFDPSGQIKVTVVCGRAIGVGLIIDSMFIPEEWEYQEIPFFTGLGIPPQCPKGWQFIRFKNTPSNVDELIDNVSKHLSIYKRCAKCTQAKLEQLVEKLRAAAETTKPKPGTLNPCERWCYGFADSAHEWYDPDCIYQAGCHFAFNVGFFGGHVVYRIVLCDGSIVYVDNGVVGGADHVGLPSEAPATCFVVNPVWGCADKSDWEDVRINQ